MRYARRRDSSEADIIDALRKAGCEVWRGSDVDLYCARAGRLWGLECKTPGRQKRLQPIQTWLRPRWPDYHVVTTPEDALRAIGAI